MDPAIIIAIVFVILLSSSIAFMMTRTPTAKTVASPASCVASSTFPMTTVGGTASAACPVGYTGTQTALCKSDGTFSSADASKCVAAKTSCAASLVFPLTAIGGTASAACPVGYTGTQTASCKADGTFSSADASKCAAAKTSCAASGVFPLTAIGGTASAACPVGYTGTQTAACTTDGTFAAANTTGCIAKPTSCTATTTFPSVAVGATGSAACPTGYTGTQTSACNADGTFGAANTSGCKAVLTSGTLATPLNQEGGQIFLDRHNVACPAKAGMANFHLVRNPPNFQESYDCLTGADIGDATGYTTPSGANLYDSTVEAKCPNGTVLNQWQVTRPTGSTMNMVYKCVPVPNLGTCTDMTTPWQTDGGGHAIYLDRLATACPPNSMLNRVRLENNGSGSQRYNYTCCAR